jgi:threonine dehydratase
MSVHAASSRHHPAITATPRAKVAGAERLGARVLFAGTTTAERMAKAMEVVAAESATLVPPYDHPWIIAGQGTAGLEIAEDAAALGLDDFTLLVQVGGGGLSAGVATAVKAVAPAARVVGVEPAGSPKLSRAREAGEPVSIGAVTFAHLQPTVADVARVDDAELAPAVRFLLDRHKLVAEPSGAITVAALLAGRVKPTGPVVCFLSGGNIEFDGLQELLAGAP